MSEQIEDPEIKKLLDCGIIAIDKPQGPSSHQVTAWVKEIFGGDMRIGHGGTLDPMVSGVLIVMLGRAVRLAPVILKHRKEYIAVLRLHGDVDRDVVYRVADEFRGRVYQRPPRRSAVRRQLRIRTMYDIEVLDFSGRLVLLRVSCEAGSYIRSLCTHLALAMGVGGQMEELRRSRSGSIGLPDTCTLQDLKDAYVFAQEGKTEELKEMILPVERLISEIPIVKIRDSAVDAVCNGAALAGVGVISKESYKRDSRVAVVTEKGELVCIGKALISSEEYKPGDTGLVVAPQAVVMKKGTYEKGWTKHEYPAKQIKEVNQADKRKYTGKISEFYKSERSSPSEKKSDFQRTERPKGRTQRTDSSERKSDFQRTERPKGRTQRTDSSERKSDFRRTERPKGRTQRTDSSERKSDFRKSERPKERTQRTDSSERKSDFRKSERPKERTQRTYSSERKSDFRRSERPARKTGDNDRPYASRRRTEYSKTERTDRPPGTDKRPERIPTGSQKRKQERIHDRESTSAPKARSGFQPYRKTRK